MLTSITMTDLLRRPKKVQALVAQGYDLEVISNSRPVFYITLKPPQAEPKRSKAHIFNPSG
jgi:hypothetical protein